MEIEFDLIKEGKENSIEKTVSSAELDNRS